ncbi:Putative CoA-transferase family III [Septoria linicola]|uniref:CoA-transferase family III n=1 Tax=Septoria linicola TaxID=215465 RepID=A0A9Q9EP06_9PEZI|nr:putative CoA-transferase family III [Septoria linicola]USW57182.1 Putative CoA-transferase family III [Septoria linicola]
MPKAKLRMFTSGLCPTLTKPASLATTRALLTHHNVLLASRLPSRASCASTAFRDKDASASSDKSSNLPLSGLLVVSLEQAIAGPFCTRQLADLGARVIKIERPGTGDFNRHHDTRVNGLCSHFVWTNRSKESLTLDLKSPSDLSFLKTKLLPKADIFLQNLAPGATQRMGLDYASLSPKHPSLIVCDISGYGSTGPYKHKKAYDLLIQAESGFLSITGTPDGQPAKSGISIADIAAGVTASQSILAAILARSRNGGKGCRLDISMLESLAEWMSFPLYYAYEGQSAPKMAGAEHASIYPYGPFKTGGDGGTVMLGMQNEREWERFCREVLGKEELLGDKRFESTALRSENRVALKGIIEDVFSGLTSGEVLERLERAGVANAKVRDMEGLRGHDQLAARGKWTEVETEVGRVKALKPAGMADGVEGRMEKIPKIGEHSERIFREFGGER